MEHTRDIQSGEAVLHVTGIDLTDQEILDGLAKENPTLYWNNIECYHWWFDFPIGMKDGKKVWCELVKCNNELDKFWINLYQ